ncbi:hypothetical protein LCGC14_0771600 [marine sediment metagenome]|uniref:Uncharacterized protein n=1 Tax=marine sediment metagenome TaxID=412755 RepID=A0A0F9QHY1_9ZZZZ
MALKDLLKKLVTSQAKEVDVPLEAMDRVKRQAEAAEKIRAELRNEKG